MAADTAASVDPRVLDKTERKEASRAIDNGLVASSCPSRSWQEIVAPYLRANPRRTAVQLVNTGLPFVLLSRLRRCAVRPSPRRGTSGPVGLRTLAPAIVSALHPGDPFRCSVNLVA